MFNVKAKQSGAWSVAINNTTANPVPVVSVDGTAAQPFQTEVSVNIPDDPLLGIIGTESFIVPAGKRLVIEYASALVALGPGNDAELIISTEVNSVRVTHKLPIPPHTEGLFTVGQVVRIYADPGTEVNLAMQRHPNGPASMEFTISGHLVDVP